MIALPPSWPQPNQVLLFVVVRHVFTSSAKLSHTSLGVNACLHIVFLSSGHILLSTHFVLMFFILVMFLVRSMYIVSVSCTKLFYLIYTLYLCRHVKHDKKNFKNNNQSLTRVDMCVKSNNSSCLRQRTLDHRSQDDICMTDPHTEFNLCKVHTITNDVTNHMSAKVLCCWYTSRHKKQHCHCVYR